MSSQRKIFIAINPDNKTKRHIYNKLEKFHDKVEAKWAPQENLHLTITFVGYLDNDKLSDFCLSLNENFSAENMFDIELNEFCWGPSPERKRMIWLRGAQNERLVELRSMIEKVISPPAANQMKFRPHITIARLRKKTALEAERLIELDKISTKIIIPVTNVDVVESLGVGKNFSYQTLESFQLQG